MTREERGKGERLQDVRGARLAYMCWVMRAEKMSSARKKKEQNGTKGKRKVGVREARTLDLRITQFSYETYALANCATTPLMAR